MRRFMTVSLLHSFCEWDRRSLRSDLSSLSEVGVVVLKKWLTAQMNTFRMAFHPADALARFSTLAEAQRLLDQIADMRYAFES